MNRWKARKKRNKVFKPEDSKKALINHLEVTVSLLDQQSVYYEYMTDTKKIWQKSEVKIVNKLTKKLCKLATQLEDTIIELGGTIK